MRTFVVERDGQPWGRGEYTPRYGTWFRWGGLSTTFPTYESLTAWLAGEAEDDGRPRAVRFDDGGAPPG